jgi:protein TonB
MKVQALAVDHDRQYSRSIRLAAACSLAAVIALFLFVPQPEVRPYQLRAAVDSLVAVDPLSLLQQAQVRPQPRHSTIPVASPDGPATDSTVGVHRYDDLHRTITEPAVEPLPYWKVERKPVLLEQVVPEYPELARSAGIEGRVVVTVVVDTAGLVAGASVLQSSGNSLLDAAALDAAGRFRFKPAMQRDRPVPVQMSIPFRFSLE